MFKTDPFRKGITIFIYSTRADLCTEKAIKKYQIARNYNFPHINSIPDPCCLLKSSKALTRSFFVQTLKSLIVDLELQSLISQNTALEGNGNSLCFS